MIAGGRERVGRRHDRAEHEGRLPGMPGTSACAAQATAHIVTSTSPTALSVSPRRLARRSPKFAKIDDA